MSFDVGKDVLFNPPPPPRRRLSPWAVTGIGCLVLVVGAIVAVSVIAVNISNTMKRELEKPINKEQILADLGYSLLYPKVLFDEEATKQGRAGMIAISRLVRAKKVTIGGFRTEDTSQKVYAWYDTELLKQGFHREEGRGKRWGGHVYRRDNEMIMVQTEAQKGEWNTLVLIRFSGLRK